MSKFTSSERRGAIVILAIIACITIYLAVSRGIGLKAPESPPVQSSVNAPVADSASFSHTKQKKTREKTPRKKLKKSVSKKTSPSSETNKSRDPLNEPV